MSVTAELLAEYNQIIANVEAACAKGEISADERDDVLRASAEDVETKLRWLAQSKSGGMYFWKME